MKNTGCRKAASCLTAAAIGDGRAVAEAEAAGGRMFDMIGQGYTWAADDILGEPEIFDRSVLLRAKAIEPIHGR